MRRAYAHAPSYSKPGEVMFLYVANDQTKLDLEARDWCAQNIGPQNEQWEFTDLGDIVIYTENGVSDHAFAFKMRWC